MNVERSNEFGRKKTIVKMSKLILYTSELSPATRSTKVLIQILGLDVEYRSVDGLSVTSSVLLIDFNFAVQSMFLPLSS